MPPAQDSEQALVQVLLEQTEQGLELLVPVLRLLQVPVLSLG